jgi:hypothetical protein
MKYTDIKTLIDPVTLRIQSGDIGAESSLSLTKKKWDAPARPPYLLDE